MRLSVPVLALMLAAAPAAAADFTRAWVTHLARGGYEEITVRRTWLGRVRIVAERGDLRREIVINPDTGEVLRDYSRSDDGRVRLPPGFDDDDDDDREDRGGRDGGDDDDNDDDDNDDEEDDDEGDDDDDDDNSGSGSSNSGSGSDNSGSGKDDD